MRFILEVIADRLKVSNRKKNDIMNDLKQRGYKTFAPHTTSKGNAAGGGAGVGGGDDAASVLETDSVDDNSSVGEGSQVGDSIAVLEKGYDYLLSMKIWSLTHERVAALTAQRDEKKRELTLLQQKTAESLWLEDLKTLEVALYDFEGTFRCTTFASINTSL